MMMLSDEDEYELDCVMQALGSCSCYSCYYCYEKHERFWRRGAGQYEEADYKESHNKMTEATER